MVMAIIYCSGINSLTSYRVRAVIYWSGVNPLTLHRVQRAHPVQGLSRGTCPEFCIWTLCRVASADPVHFGGRLD